MPELKPLHKEAIPKAITRAKHYRLLNEPWQAESICRDILKIDPDHQKALLFLILSITDQFGPGKKAYYSEAKKLCEQLKSKYDQNYYRGIVEERIGKTALNRATPRARYIAYEHYYSAMKYFEQAEKLSPKGNEDSVLRWNACVRGIEEFKLEPSPDEPDVHPFLDM